MPADVELLEEVYAFARARALEGTQKRGMDQRAREQATSRLRHVQWAYAEGVRATSNAALAAAIDVCRKAAMRDSDHPDYDPLWTIPEK